MMTYRVLMRLYVVAPIGAFPISGAVAIPDPLISLAASGSYSCFLRCCERSKVADWLERRSRRVAIRRAPDRVTGDEVERPTHWMPLSARRCSLLPSLSHS